MSRTPRVTGSEVIAAIGKAGFSILRVKGSHHFLRHEDGRSTVGPRTLARPSALAFTRFFGIAN